jgi:hypothetical protein
MDKLSVDKLSVDKLSVDKLSVDKLSVDKLSVDKLSVDILTSSCSLANLLSCINSSANFLVYMLRGKKFRDAFVVTYGCGLRRNARNQRHLARQQTTRWADHTKNTIFPILHICKIFSQMCVKFLTNL